jgi:glycosyltransferase involved in cell wall biosynthesis
VVALRRGALPEVIAEGTTGVLVNDAQEMIAGLPRVTDINPESCRHYAEQHYSSRRMADAYEELYRIALKKDLTVQSASSV